MPTMSHLDVHTQQPKCQEGKCSDSSFFKRDVELPEGFVNLYRLYKPFSTKSEC